jgi:hypothetical protein
MILEDVVFSVTLLPNNCIIFRRGRQPHKEREEVAMFVYSEIKMLNEVVQKKNNAVTKRT